ncbi:MAG: DNA adenine methylase [Armatimonadetes bacterium]|nr:DNA adenine methylase [Armatimonadota bacterium]
MPFYTPLRYPGGKRRLAPVVASLLRENGLRDVQYVEPYAGGAALGLALLFEEYASVIHLNDLSRPVYAFWYTVLNHSAELCRRIEQTAVTMNEWWRQRAVYDARATAALEDLGFATLFLNRTNRSGIISGGVIGGKEQSGKWGLDARFNKAELVQRIRRIARYRNRIKLYHLDALDFTNQILSEMEYNTLAFFDPPYIENGEDLYLNEYTLEGHRQLAARIVLLECPWLVTYDYSAVGHDLYPMHPRIAYGLSYSAQSRRKGREVMFLSHHLRLPDDWCRPGQFTMTPRSEYPIYGVMEGVKSPVEIGRDARAAARPKRARKAGASAQVTAAPSNSERCKKKRKKLAGATKG